MKGIILLADGSPAIRRNISEVLFRDGHRVHEAENGKEALDFFGAATFDLLICDMNMSHLNGIELVRKMNEFSEKRKTRLPPVILMVTDSGEGLSSEAREAGVSALISKPFAPEDILATVRKLLR
jgi:two-component system chemotaxis response regulator CheY